MQWRLRSNIDLSPQNGHGLNGLRRSPPGPKENGVEHKKEGGHSPGTRPGSGASSSCSTPAPPRRPEEVSGKPRPSTATPPATAPEPGAAKPGLPGPPFQTNGHGDSYRLHESIRAPPQGAPPGGKP